MCGVELNKIVLCGYKLGVVSWSLFEGKLYLDVILYNKERYKEVDMKRGVWDMINEVRERDK